jgi:hypothetical protein
MQPDPRVAGSAIYAWIAEDFYYTALLMEWFWMLMLQPMLQEFVHGQELHQIEFLLH